MRVGDLGEEKICFGRAFLWYGCLGGSRIGLTDLIGGAWIHYCLVFAPLSYSGRASAVVALTPVFFGVKCSPRSSNTTLKSFHLSI